MPQPQTALEYQGNPVLVSEILGKRSYYIIGDPLYSQLAGSTLSIRSMRSLCMEILLVAVAKILVVGTLTNLPWQQSGRTP